MSETAVILSYDLLPPPFLRNPVHKLPFLTALPPPSLPPYLLSSLPPQASISENVQANAAERLQEAKMRGEINVLGGPLEVRISLCAL